MSEWRVAFKAFDSKMASREKLFRAAVEYATQIGRERLITMSHSEDHDQIVVTIWYWTDEPEGAEFKAKMLGGWKQPELKSTGEKILETKMATSGTPGRRPAPPPSPPKRESLRKRFNEPVPKEPGATDE
jgi:hypothetical protein